MLRTFRKLLDVNYRFNKYRTFLSNSYKCSEEWNNQCTTATLNVSNLNDFYNNLEQQFTTKGCISALDVDIFANSIQDENYLEELKDLVYKLRLSTETGETLESTHVATVRKFLQFGSFKDILLIIKNPLDFGIFLDKYVANILLNESLLNNDYENAAEISASIMLQEDFGNEITVSLSQFACFKYIDSYVPPEIKLTEITEKPEVIKIRIKYLRNPYFDDHFDIKDTFTLAGKTLAWLPETKSNFNPDLKIIGWFAYKKFDKLLELCESIENTKVISTEVIDILEKHKTVVSPEQNPSLEQCISILKRMKTKDVPLEETLRNSIENSINICHSSDIEDQKKQFAMWAKIRQDKIIEQTKRLDRAKRIEAIQEKQKEMQKDEQKLWFFENEEKIDLEIEKKEMKNIEENVKINTKDEEYIPPEVRSQKR